MTNGWQVAKIGDVSKPIQRAQEPQVGTVYRQVGVRLWGQGAYERESIDGSETKYKTLSRIESGDIILNKIWARNGSVAVVNDELAGCFGSGEFPTFEPDRNKLEPKWFHWITKTRWFWEACDKKSQGTSGKNRIRPEKFLEIDIPLPPLREQRRIVAHIESLASRVNAAQRLREEINTDLDRLLLSAYHDIADNVERKPLEKVAPLTRRPANIDIEKIYPQIAVRSFGRGTFHKPNLEGEEITWQKPYLVKSGDILISNIKAWEGAIAVARDNDDGRYGSHRYLTCVPTPGVATSRFICFHLLTAEGLLAVGEASPGSADRNRTLGAKALMQIMVPMPTFEKQLWFDKLYAKVSSMRELQSASAEELSALMPSILDKAFKGEL